MFKKVLIVEDQEIMNLGIINTLKELNIQHFDFVSYCDEALHRLHSATKDKNPYDLLITDLSFDKDHIPQTLQSGQDLILEAKKSQPDLKVIVLSVEKRAKVIDELYKIHGIQAFISKARNDGKELRKTLKKVFEGETVFSQDILNKIRQIPRELNDYDLKLLKLLSQGCKQKEMAGRLKVLGMKPYSTRSIEKRLNELRESLGAQNNIEMVVIGKDIGLI